MGLLIEGYPLQSHDNKMQKVCFKFVLSARMYNEVCAAVVESCFSLLVLGRVSRVVLLDRIEVLTN